ncbi:MAG: hypothetical protein AAGF11_37625 [Myxococcota bacterium]
MTRDTARSISSFVARMSLTGALGLVSLACTDADPSSDPDQEGTTTEAASETTSDSTTGDPDASTSGVTEQPGSSTSAMDTTDGESDTESTGAVACDVDAIELPGDTFYPEGVAADAAGHLYIGSLATGAVVMADPCTGEVDELVPAGGTLTNPVGLIVDEGNATLVVCNSDFTFATPPSIDMLDLADGALLGRHAFEGPGFCNDLTFDDEGNVYATDSAAARVVRVPAAEILSDSPVQTWATDPDFAVGEGEFGLNGIAFDGDSSLYVVNYAQGELHRIAIEPDGLAGSVTAIALGQTALAAPDGLEWIGDGQLLVVEGDLGAVSRIELSGDTATVEVVADGYDVPTTIAQVDDHIWVGEGQLDHLIGIDPADPEPPFVVTRLPL